MCGGDFGLSAQGSTLVRYLPRQSHNLLSIFAKNTRCCELCEMYLQMFLLWYLRMYPHMYLLMYLHVCLLMYLHIHFDVEKQRDSILTNSCKCFCLSVSLPHFTECMTRDRTTVKTLSALTFGVRLDLKIAIVLGYVGTTKTGWNQIAVTEMSPNNGYLKYGFCIGVDLLYCLTS